MSSSLTTLPQQEYSGIVTLRGKKTVLRPIEEADLPLLVRWLNDQEIVQYLMRYLPVSMEEEKEWFKQLSADKSTDIVFAIVPLAGTYAGQLIGTMGIHRISWRDGIAFTGATIGVSEYQGKGYGADAKMNLLNYAFNTLNLRKICSMVLAFNERSLRYSARCGYKIEGRRVNQVYRNGAYHDEVLLGVFKEDWLPIWERYQNTGNVK